ncbi:MAG: ACT domain-containing protein [Nocardioidaceae bacterium]
MSHLLRIVLPDVPGSLGAVASAIGATGANINAIEIVEQRSDGTAVDDVFVEVGGGVLPDMVVSAVQRLDGVRVLWISRYAASGNLNLDLEAVELLTQEPDRALERLTELAPRIFRSDWALVASAVDGHLARVHASPGSPVLPAAALGWFPVDKPARPEIPAGWEGFSATAIAVAPLGSSQHIIAFGRHGGPEILDSELARLGHLAALTGSIHAG